MINLFLEKKNDFWGYMKNTAIYLNKCISFFFTKYDFSNYFAYKNINVKLSQVNRLKDFFFTFLYIFTFSWYI